MTVLLLAAAHLIGLGFLTTVIVGAVQHLAPNMSTRRLVGGRAVGLTLWCGAVILAVGLGTGQAALEGIGGTASLIGLAFAVSAASELPVIALGGWFLARLGAFRLAVLAIAVYAARFVAFSVITEPELVLGVQVFHGLSYGAFLMASVTLAHRLAPPGRAATAQALLTAMSFGFGSIAGSLIGGRLHRGYGGAAGEIGALHLLGREATPETLLSTTDQPLHPLDEQAVTAVFAQAREGDQRALAAVAKAGRDRTTVVVSHVMAIRAALGVTMGLSLLGIGLGAIHWAKTLMPDEESVELRHAQASPEDDRVDVSRRLFIAANNGPDRYETFRRVVDVPAGRE